MSTPPTAMKTTRSAATIRARVLLTRFLLLSVSERYGRETKRGVRRRVDLARESARRSRRRARGRWQAARRPRGSWWGPAARRASRGRAAPPGPGGHGPQASEGRASRQGPPAAGRPCPRAAAAAPSRRARRRPAPRDRKSVVEG